MHINRRTILAGAAGSTALALAPVAFALSEDEAKAHVSRTIDDLKALLRESGTAASRAPRLRQIMETRANVPLLARFAAGPAWRDMSEDQQARFTEAFARSISITYSRRFDDYTGEPDITVGKAIDAGKKGILVETPVAGPNGKPISVEWRVTDRFGRVEIIDLSFEGIWLTITQREEIGAMFKKRGGDVERLISDLAAWS